MMSVEIFYKNISKMNQKCCIQIFIASDSAVSNKDPQPETMVRAEKENFKTGSDRDQRQNVVDRSRRFPVLRDRKKSFGIFFSNYSPSALTFSRLSGLQKKVFRTNGFKLKLLTTYFKFGPYQIYCPMVTKIEISN